jgi:hypothetical protein
MVPRSFTATERAIMKLHLTVIVCVSYILYSLLFRTASGLVVRVSSYRYRGPGFDSWRYEFF